MDLEKLLDLENHALILMDHISAIFSNRAIGMVVKDLKDIFSHFLLPIMSKSNILL